MNFFDLPALPYQKNALSPFISEKTLDFHYGKHHQTYVNKLNDLLRNESDLQTQSLENVILKSHSEQKTGIFNNAAQIWNHTFYWQSMKPNNNKIETPTGVLKSAIDNAFGSWENFKQEFKQAGISLFGSGWVWLVVENGKLIIKKTSNADLPMIAQNQTPLMTMDVWEHAYYFDYQNVRKSYIDVFFDHLVNWEFAAKNLQNA